MDKVKVLHYGFDPCCGWCFGIIPAMRRVRAEFPALPIAIHLGGLFVGARVQPLAAFQPYIAERSKHLARVTGQHLSRAFFEQLLPRADVPYSSLPPSAAIAAFRERASAELTLEFCHRVLEKFFVDACDQNRLELYTEIAAELGVEFRLDAATYERACAEAEAEFVATHALGITSYPTLIVERTDGQRVVLPSLYQPTEVVALVREAGH